MWAPRVPMDTLTCSDHRSEGGTSKSLAKACFVHWRTLASWSPLCSCKSEETPVDRLVTPHQYRCQWKSLTPESYASRTGRPSRNSGERAHTKQGSRALLFSWPATRRSPPGMEQAIHTVQWCGESTVLRLIYYNFNYFIWDTLFCPYLVTCRD